MHKDVLILLPLDVNIIINLEDEKYIQYINNSHIDR